MRSLLSRIRSLPFTLQMLFAVVALIVPQSLAQPVITPIEESRIWIEGRSNVNQFECTASHFNGEARQKEWKAGTETEQEWRREEFELYISIPVEQLECGRSRMNRDLYDALKADEHEEITFRYLSAEIISADNGTYELEVVGILMVAGTSRDIQFRADGSMNKDRQMRVRGSKTVRMTDFDVEPPTGLLGLVKAEDELTVHFDIYAKQENRDVP